MKFKLHSPFKPTGDQPQAIAKLVEGINSGHKFQTLLGTTGSGKSVTSETPVLTKESGSVRIVKIGEFTDNLFSQYKTKVKIINDSEVLTTEDLPQGTKFEAWSFDPEKKKTAWKPIKQFIRHNAPKQLFNIITTCGRKVSVTGDHNFFVLRDGQLKLLKTSELEQNDYLPVPRQLPKPSKPLGKISLINESSERGSFVSLPNFAKIWKRQEKKLRSSLTSVKIHNILYNNERVSLKLYQSLVSAVPDLQQKAKVGSFARDYQFPPDLPLDENFMRLLGYYVAEGHSTGKYFIISSNDEEIVSDLKTTIQELGLRHKKRPNSYDYQISSSFLTKLLEKWCGKNSQTKKLPYFWPQLSQKQLAELLAAYFSTDGGVDGQAITCTTASESLASDLLWALLRFGIVGRLRQKSVKIPNKNERGQYWVVSISGQKHLSLFQEHIDFIISKKVKSLKKISGSNYNTNVDVIPIDGWWLKKVRTMLNLRQEDLSKSAQISRSLISLFEENKRNPSQHTFKRLVKFLERMANSQKKYEALKEIQNQASLLNLFWSPIKEVQEKAGGDHVYDFAVEENETFLAGTGGIFVHNTFTMANVIQAIQKPTLVISHNKTLTAQLASEFQEFFPDNAVHYFVSYYDYYQPEAYIPRTDTYIEKETDINEEIDRLRNAATTALLTRKDVLIVASVSCIYGLGNPADYLELSFELSSGKSYKRDKFLRRLVDLQYQRNDMDLRRGSFRVRGDVIEIVPASEDRIIRLDFFGDELEKITEFDPSPLTKTEESRVRGYHLFPAKHFLTPHDKLLEAVKNIRAELGERLALFKKQGKLLEAQRLEQRTNFDIEMMLEAGYVNGIENYSRHLDGRNPGEPPSTLLDYFPDDFLLFIDESHMTVPQIRGMYEGDRSRKLTLVEYGFRLPSALDNRPLQFKEFLKKVSQAVFVSATPAPYEIGRSQAVVEQVVRPTGLLDPEINVKPTKNQVDDLMEEIDQRVKASQRVLVTTLTKRMAEELSEYLRELGVKSHYLHADIDTFERLEILRDLRLGEYDVVVGINLLREGLDLPEVSLVAILDADKEGYLRSKTALLQVMGRAARHREGKVIMYADKTTGSMREAIEESNRRRQIQKEYNRKHNITPRTIIKAVSESRLAGAKLAPAQAGAHPDQIDLKQMDKKQIRFYLEELKDRMDLAAKNLEFEKAAELRDEISQINKSLRRQRHKI